MCTGVTHAIKHERVAGDPTRGRPDDTERTGNVAHAGRERDLARERNPGRHDVRVSIEPNEVAKPAEEEPDEDERQAG